MLRKFLFCLIILVCFQGFSQLSKTHYIPPLTFADSGSSTPQEQYIYISTPRNSDVPYTIMPVGQPEANYITGVVSNNNAAEIFIGSGGNTQLFIPSPTSSVVSANKGYIIEAEDVIYVSVRMTAAAALSQAGALVSKGLSAPDTTFRIGSYTNENPQDNYLNFASVMATEDDTQVSFSNLPAGVVIQNYTGPTPVNITLNEGESYVLALNSFDALVNRTGLIGCLVNSTKPIVVNCGSANGSFGGGRARDYGIDQIVGLSKIGTEYIFVRGDGTDAWENVLIVAHTDNTAININGNNTGTVINAGEFFVIEGNNFSANGNMYVETSQPVFAYQGVGGLGNSGAPSEANQGMFFVPPLSCETRGNLDNIAAINQIGNITYEGGITIVTKNTATVAVTSSITGNINLGAPSPVIGKTDYITYKIKGIRGNITVTGNDELYCAYFNYNGNATSGSFYSGFPSPPEINFDLQFTALGNCIPNVTLEAANSQNFDSFKWLFDDGSGAGFIDLMETNATIVPTTSGTYKLVGIIACTGEELESIEIPVSICPDDSDNDGVIDNLDIDNDNDGILNCTESRGDAILNLVNSGFTGVAIELQDGSNIQNEASYNFSTLVGGSETVDASGNFISNIPPSVSDRNIHEFSFVNDVSFRLLEDVSVTHNIVNGETFIVSILPVNKNITLVNTDNRLLVDSNFDGIFESGVTQISGSEIRFRYNPSPNGNEPYVFYAQTITGFNLEHEAMSTVAASQIALTASLTCYENDNDSDGIKDEFDLDSDNDGIPDFIENQGIFTPLSGVDANNDGLDDAFASFTNPIDSDNDGVFDFYDLDSDNDGIYDLIESGQLGSVLSDTNLDGIEDGPGFGINGWADAAETAPDSNLIGYTLNDLDNDSIFSYLDNDSDGDLCNDVIEAGFSDGDNNGILGDIAPTINNNGVVNNATDGYTVPNTDYLTIAPITIDSQTTTDVTCEGSSITMSVISAEAETAQWEISTDSGTTWTVMSDDATFSGTNTFDLTVNNAPLSLNNTVFRAFLNRSGNSCGIYSQLVNITVNPLPTITSLVTLVQCDDDDTATLGFSFFNLTEAENNISGNAINETFTYYTTQNAAENGDATVPEFITNFSAYENTNSGGIGESIWARVETNDGCHRVAEVDLIVTATQIPNPNLELYSCDDNLDENGNDNANNDKRDGISSFDLTTATIVIPPGLNTLPPRYYRTEADALAEENEITDLMNYRNIGFPGTQQIFVRIDSNVDNSCVGLGPFITLFVEELPIANTVTVAPQCDADLTDGLISFPFDTSTIEGTILNGQSLADVSITYNYLDISGNAITSNTLPNPFLTETQDINVVVTNNNTQSPDGPCLDETVISFVVNEQPIISNTVAPQEFCDGSAGDIDDDGIYPFNTTTFTATILGSQVGTMDIFYDYIDENGDAITNSPNLPNTLNSANQTISVTVVNPNNTNCVASTTIDFIVNPLPEFNLLPEDGTICTTSTPVEPLLLEAELANPSETFTYEWRWTSLDGTVTDAFLSNAVSISADQPGVYALTLTKTDGTGCEKRNEILVDSAQEAILNIDNIEVSKPSHTHTVTIIDTTILGPDDYEYALVAEDSNIINYQDSPVFTNVNPGFYTLYVKDIDEICEPSSIPIAVIGYQRFFTPNGDGVNEFWNIKGIDTSQANSIIRIYDRYGKLIKQITALSDGWDGTFNGELMPTNDYWFKVNLDDGRSFMGHFTLKR